MANKVFQITAFDGATFNGNDLTASVATIESGLLVVKDVGADTVSLAGASGSAPLGVAYFNRDLVYKPTSNLAAIGEAVTVVNGHFYALVSSDFFSSGSIPADAAGPRTIFAAANGLLDWSGTNKVGRLIAQKTETDPTGGTGTTNTLARIEFNIVP